MDNLNLETFFTKNVFGSVIVIFYRRISITQRPYGTNIILGIKLYQRDATVKIRNDMLVLIKFRKYVVVEYEPNDFQNYFEYVCTLEGLKKPSDRKRALNLYTILKQISEQG